MNVIVERPIESIVADGGAVPEVSLLTRGRLRSWGMKSVLSLVDQALTSGAGFAVNVLLARWLSAESYGAFAVGFAGYLLLAGFHNVLILEPLSVIGPARHSEDLGSYFKYQMAVHSLLVLPLALIAALIALVLRHFVPANPLVGAFAGGGIALPFLLFLWLARRMCYVRQRPALAVKGSGAYFVFSVMALVGLRLTNHVTPFTAFLATAMASLIGAAWISRSVESADAQSWEDLFKSTLHVLRENWLYGRWLVGSTMLFFASGQIQTFLLAAFLGLGAAGVLRATQVPSLVVTQIITAVGMLALPSFAFDFGSARLQRIRLKASLMSFTLGAGSFLAVLLLWSWSKPIEHLLFAGKYASEAWLMAILALVPCANAISTGYSMALRASQKPHFDLLANSIAAPVGLISAIVLMRRFGLAGAGISMVLGATTVAIVTFTCYRLAMRGGQL